MAGKFNLTFEVETRVVTAAVTADVTAAAAATRVAPQATAQPITILLAPMEGLLDFVLRDILTRVGGYDRCVSEFIRITDQLLPDRVFQRIIPELHNGGRTISGVPVRAQLLGSDPNWLAENAVRLAGLGPEGIDLNFGCPAKLVNRHGGGAALLQDPDIIFQIVSSVRKAVPAHMPVSAKMRLGYHDDTLALECAQAIEAGGACELVVHARTKLQAYKPPAYWGRIADIRAVVQIPIYANGEIWTSEDARSCMQASHCNRLMLGRGAVADPGLALAVRADHFGSQEILYDGITWPQVLPLIRSFWQLVCERLEPKQQAGRLKQWLNLMRRRYPQAEVAYQHIKVLNENALIDNWLRSAG